MSIATELTALQGYITSAYNAVQTKGGTIPADKNMANLDDAILSIQNSIVVTNGAIEQYKAATSNIPADTFIEFVPEYGYGNPLSTSVMGSTTFFPAQNNFGTYKLEDNKTLTVVSRGGQTYGCVCTYSGDTPTIGSYSTLSSGSTPEGNFNYNIVDSTHFVCAHRNYEDGVAETFAYLHTISGATISRQYYGLICSGSQSQVGDVYAVIPLSSTSVLFLYSYLSSVYSRQYTISGSTMSPDAAGAQIAGSPISGRCAGSVLSNGDYIVFYAKTTAGNGLSAVLGSAPTNAVSIMSAPASGYMLNPRILPLGSDRFLVASGCSSGASAGGYKIALVGVSNGSISVLDTASITDVLYNSAGTTPISMSAGGYNMTSLPNGDVLLVLLCGSMLRSSSTVNVGTIEITISGNNIVLGKPCLVDVTTYQSGACPAVSAINSGENIVLTHRPTSTTYSLSVIDKTGIISKTVKASETRIDGLTAEGITTAAAGDVWVLSS